MQREILKGKGKIICKIPFEDIAVNHGTDIKNMDDFQNVAEQIIAGITDSQWTYMQEHAIINALGYAIAYEYPHNVNRQSHSKMIFLERSNECMLHSFGDGLVLEAFGDDFELCKISIVMSDVEAREGVQHINFPATLSDEETNYTIICTLKVMGNVCGWDYSQHIVRAVKRAQQKISAQDRVEPAKYLSHVRELLEENMGFEIDIEGCVKRSNNFGLDEMMIIGGNYVHCIAKNGVPEDSGGERGR